MQEAARVMPAIVGRAVVVDGDTIEIAGRTIRLQGIDAPESAQACEWADGAAWRCGKAATEALDAMAGGRIVMCRQDARDAEDRYGRALAMCRAGERDMNVEMVRQGFAVAYRQYLDWPDRTARPHKAVFLAAETEARLSRTGIWQGRFTLPAEWRAARRGRAGDPSTPAR
jgi:endonuclease YncB( thermonuclease family)